MKKIVKLLGSFALLGVLGFSSCETTKEVNQKDQTPEHVKLAISEWNETYKESTRIYQIQGDTHNSPMKGQEVTNVPGIVTGIKRSNNSTKNFFIQDLSGDNNKVTSDGIQIFFKDENNTVSDLTVGDIVLVSGKVDEFGFKKSDLSTTQISATTVTVVEKGKTDLLPKPVVITYADISKNIFDEGSDLNAVLDPDKETIDYYESLESMRVTVENPIAVAVPYKSTDYIIPGDTTSKFSENGGIVLNGYNTSDFIFLNSTYCFENREAAGLESGYNLKGGDSFTGNITGVLGYNYSNFEIEMTEQFPALTKSTQTEGKANPFAPEKLNIVSYNVENFSKTKFEEFYKGRKNFLGNPNRASRFADEFVNKLNAPDIICLIEIQDDNSGVNDGTVSATETLQLLIDEINKIDNNLKYAPVNVDPANNMNGGAPGSNIRCCYLYRTDRIELVPDSDNDFTNSNSSTEAQFDAENGRLIQNPARIGSNLLGKGDAFEATRNPLVAHFKFLEGINGGKDFVLINNHLKSKRGDEKAWGSSQPAKRVSEDTRWRQAHIISDFIKSTGDTPVISVGDYNDFWFSETTNIMKTPNNMINVIETLPENERYTYTYSGYSQTLDQILVKGFSKVEGGVLHVNSIKPKHYATADETEWPADCQLSDHDPVWAQLTF